MQNDAIPPPVSTVTETDETLWPVYFSRAPLDAPNLQLELGGQFPFQSKAYLRGLGEVYGCERADVRPFDRLSFIGVLMVPRRLYSEIRDKNMTYAEAVVRLERWRAAQAT